MKFEDQTKFDQDLASNSEVAQDNKRLAGSFNDDWQLDNDESQQDTGEKHEAERGAEMTTEKKKLYPDFLELAVPTEDDVLKA